MTDYTVGLIHDWAQVGGPGSAEPLLSCSVAVDWLAGGRWTAVLPIDHAPAQRVVDWVASGQDPRRSGIVVRPVGSSETAAVCLLEDLTVADGEVSGYAPDSITLSGVDAMAVLAGTPAYPDPAVDSSTTGVTTWPVYSDGPSWASAEDAIVELVRGNLGSGAAARRRLIGDALVVPSSQGRGAAVTYRRRFPSLLEATRELCLAGGLTARLDLSGGQLTLVIEEQQLAPGVVWSRATAGVAGVAMTWSAAELTDVLALGAGEGAARVASRAERAEPPGGWAWRAEATADATSDNTYAELQDTATEDLQDTGAAIAAIVDIDADAVAVLGRDLSLGDLTRVSVDAGSSRRVDTARVEGVELSLEQSGWRTDWQIGPPLGDPAAVQARIIRGLRRRSKQ